MPAADLLNMLEIACRRHDHAACPLNRLGDEGGDVGGADLDDLVLEPACRVGGEFGLVLIALVKEAVGRPDMGETGLVGGLVVHALHPAEAGGHDGAAVIAELAADDHPLFRFALKRPVMTDHADDGVVRLGPGIGVEDVAQPVRGDLGELGRQFRHRLVTGPEEIVVIGQLRHLGCRRLDQFGPAISDIHAPQPGHAVEDTVPVTVVDVMALGMGDDPRALPAQIPVISERRHVMRRIQGLPFVGGNLVKSHVGTVGLFSGPCPAC